MPKDDRPTVVTPAQFRYATQSAQHRGWNRHRVCCRFSALRSSKQLTAFGRFLRVRHPRQCRSLSNLDVKKLKSSLADTIARSVSPAHPATSSALEFSPSLVTARRKQEGFYWQHKLPPPPHPEQL